MPARRVAATIAAMSDRQRSRSPRRTITAVTAALAAGAMLAPTAAAECRNVWQPDFSGETGGSLELVCDYVPSGGGGGGGGGGGNRPASKPKPRKATAKQLRALRFPPSASAASQLSSATANTLIGELDLAADDPKIPTFQAELTQPAIDGDFDAKLVRKRGWSTSDLGDVYTAAFLEGWRVVNKVPASKIRAATVKAVRKDIRNELALDPKVRRASDAAQRRWAYQLRHWTSLMAALYDDSARRNLSNVDSWRVRLQNVFRYPSLDDIDQLSSTGKLGWVDLEKVRLGARGVTVR